MSAAVFSERRDRIRPAVEWLPGLAVACIVPIANFYLTHGHVLGAANDTAIFIVLLFLVPMTMIWGFIERRINLWVRMWPIVLAAFGIEMLSWMLQRGHYGLWRIGNVAGKCGTADANEPLCKDVSLLLTELVWIPGALQWFAAVSMICIASPVLANYMPKHWFIISVTAATSVWWAMLYTFMVIS